MTTFCASCGKEITDEYRVPGDIPICTQCAATKSGRELAIICENTRAKALQAEQEAIDVLKLKAMSFTTSFAIDKGSQWIDETSAIVTGKTLAESIQNAETMGLMEFLRKAISNAPSDDKKQEPKKPPELRPRRRFNFE